VRADDPTSTVPVYDPDADAVTTRSFHKVYHLNLVMVFRCGRRAAGDEAGPGGLRQARHPPPRRRGLTP
jgi:hypothetical protein